MATFPDREADIMALAMELLAGLNAHPEVYPAPPVLAGSLSGRINAVLAKQAAVMEAKAVLEQKVEAKNVDLASLVQGMKDDFSYAEVTTHMDDELLKLIGWGAHKAATPLAPPGQALELRIADEGPGTIALAWRKPLEGGAVQAYRVQRLKPGASVWFEVGMAFEPEIELGDQERGLEFSYRVVASNKAGNATPSNVVTAVL